MTRWDLSGHYVSFVIRALVDDSGQLASGQVWRVPSQTSRPFKQWAQLIELLKQGLSQPEDDPGSRRGKDLS